MLGSEFPMLVMLGVTSAKAITSAAHGQNWAMKQAQGIEQDKLEEHMRQVMLKLPPEALALMYCTCLNSILHLIEESGSLAAGMRLAGQQDANDSRKVYFSAIFDLAEEKAKEIRDACAARAAEGWPEWDYNAEHTKPVDLEHLLDGLDLGWLGEEAS